jgi:hypothetical protein
MITNTQSIGILLLDPPKLISRGNFQSARSPLLNSGKPMHRGPFQPHEASSSILASSPEI